MVNWIHAAYNSLQATFREVSREQQEAIQQPGQCRAAAGVLLVACVMLVLREEQYRPTLEQCFDALRALGGGRWFAIDEWESFLNQPANRRLSVLAYWSLWQGVTYILIPLGFLRFGLRQSPRDFGLKLRSAFSLWWVYVGMYFILLPLVLWVAGEESFQQTYPFFHPLDVGSAGRDAYWQRFWIWEFFYALQFISLEFFFRGFLLHGTRRVLGVHSILVMTIPYCMIHFGKPLPETLGAIVAGLVLGTMSLKTRSIWMGAATHIAVALTMDLAALGILAMR